MTTSLSDHLTKISIAGSSVSQLRQLRCVITHIHVRFLSCVTCVIYSLVDIITPPYQLTNIQIDVGEIQILLSQRYISPGNKWLVD